MKFVDNDYSFNAKSQATKERWKIGSLPSLPSMSLLTVDYTHTPQEDKEYWAKRELNKGSPPVILSFSKPSGSIDLTRREISSKLRISLLGRNL